MLPVGPTGAGNSPYTSESTFAGNPLLIDQMCIRDRLDHVPFPLEAERRAFAAACRPAYARHFPAALEELEGLAAGQNCRQEDLETVLFLSLIHISRRLE